MQLGGRHAGPQDHHGDPDDPARGKAMAAGAGVAISILALGLLTWMALDIDNDGMSSYSELNEGTSPMKGDSDGDGVADGWELEHGYDALSATSAPDIALEDPKLSDQSLSDLENCAVGDLVELSCNESDESSGESEADAPALQAEAPPSGGNGQAGSLVIGGATTLVAGVAARLISSAILHKS